MNNNGEWLPDLDAQGKIESKSMPVTESGCWLWLASVNQRGYGWTGFRNPESRAHRASYVAFKGEIDIGMFVCHKCDTPSCVNPDHLVIGTHTDNMRDASSKKRLGRQSETHCKNGHERTEANTRLRTGRRAGKRECLICHRAAMAASWIRRRDAA